MKYFIALIPANNLKYMNEYNSQLVEPFLSCFPGYYIQTLDDKASKGADNRREALRELVRDGKPEAFRLEQLIELNQRGAGIFFAPNKFTGQRKKELCEGVNAWFMEIDGIPKEEQWQKILNSPLNPSIIVESGNSYHVYWLAVNGTMENWDKIIRGIIQHFGADPACKDISRVLRLPGLYHNKREPYLVKIVHANYHIKYSEKEMMEAFPFTEHEYKPSTRTHQPITEGLSFWEAVSRLDNKMMLQRLSGTFLVNHEQFSFRPRSGGGEYIDVNGQPADAWLDANGMIGSGKHGGPTYIQWIEFYGWKKGDIAKWLKANCADLLPASALKNKTMKKNDTIVEEKNFAPIPLTELMKKEFEDTEWLVENLIPATGTIAVSGAPSSYKTWLVLDLALRVAGGDILFDKFVTAKTGVLIVDEENGERLLQRRIQKLNATANLPVHVLSLKGFNLLESTIRQLISFSEKNDVGFVIFDALVRIHSSDENNAMEMSQVFKLLKDFNKVGITVLFTHHNRKQGMFKSNPSQDMRGSSDILAAVDCHLAIDRKDEYLVVTQTKLRQGEEMKPFKINIINEENEMKFEFAGEIDEVQSKKADFKEGIKDILEQEGKPMYKKELFEKLKNDGVEGGYSTFKTAVQEMVENDGIFEQKGGKNKMFCSLKPFEVEQTVMMETKVTDG